MLFLSFLLGLLLLGRCLLAFADLHLLSLSLSFLRSDLDCEPDQWSRRHVPLDFQHATFPLSLAAACATALANRQAREEAKAAAANGGAGGKKDRKKRKENAEPEPAKIAASFSAAAAAPAAATAADSAAAPASLSSFVQRMARTPAARNNYSGLANTLKHMRKQQSAAAATAAGEDSKSAAEVGSKRKGGRQVPYAADASSTATPAASQQPSLVGAAAVARLPLLSHVGNPADFHPQVTHVTVAQLTKTANASTATLKKQKISHAF